MTARHLALFLLMAAAPAARLEAQRAVISGVVRDGDGIPVAGVQLSVGARSVARTDEAGKYSFEVEARGPVSVTARRIGYRPEVATVRAEPGKVTEADMRIDEIPDNLDAVQITARADAPPRRMVDFWERVQKKNGGYFILREQIEKSSADNVLQLIRSVPGVRIGGNSIAGRAVRIRGKSCAPLVFIDGFPASAGPFDLESVDVASVEGIEIYSGIGSVPPAFMGPRGLDQCGVIAIWGRQASGGRSVGRAPKPTVGEIAADRVRAMLASSLAYSADGVETAVALEQDSFVPVYPAALVKDRVHGRVRVEFVVDSTGTLMWGTYSVVASSDRRFESAVRDALQLARFTPAQRAGRKVAQVVQMPISFTPPDSAILAR